MKILYIILSTIFFIPYFGAYAISHIFKLKDRENMPKIKEWFNFNAETEEE